MAILDPMDRLGGGIMAVRNEDVIETLNALGDLLEAAQRSYLAGLYPFVTAPVR